MRAQDVKVGSEYLHEGELVTVVERIKGAVDRRKTNNQFWNLGIVRKPKKFKLSSGKIVKAKELCLNKK